MTRHRQSLVAALVAALLLPIAALSPRVLTARAGDTPVHEVGHWMGLYHSFGSTASHQFVADARILLVGSLGESLRVAQVNGTATLVPRDAGERRRFRAVDAQVEGVAEGGGVRVERVSLSFERIDGGQTDQSGDRATLDVVIVPGPVEVPGNGWWTSQPTISLAGTFHSEETTISVVGVHAVPSGFNR